METSIISTTPRLPESDRKMRAAAASVWDTLWRCQPRNLHQILLLKIISNVSLKPSLTECCQRRDHIRPLRGNHGMVGFIIITDSTNGHQSGCQWLPRDWETCPAVPAVESHQFKHKYNNGTDRAGQQADTGHLCSGLTLHYWGIML